MTNPERVQRGIREGAADAVSVKMNQIGTLTETFRVIDQAREAGFGAVISARWGNGSIPGRFAVASAAGQDRRSIHHPFRTPRQIQPAAADRPPGAYFRLIARGRPPRRTCRRIFRCLSGEVVIDRQFLAFFDGADGSCRGYARCGFRSRCWDRSNDYNTRRRFRHRPVQRPVAIQPEQVNHAALLFAAAVSSSRGLMRSPVYSTSLCGAPECLRRRG